MCAKLLGQRESAMCCQGCSFRVSPVVFCTMRDTDSCNRAILTVFHFQGAESEPHQAISFLVSKQALIKIEIHVLYQVEV